MIAFPAEQTLIAGPCFPAARELTVSAALPEFSSFFGDLMSAQSGAERNQPVSPRPVRGASAAAKCVTAPAPTAGPFASLWPPALQDVTWGTALPMAEETACKEEPAESAPPGMPRERVKTAAGAGPCFADGGLISLPVPTAADLCTATSQAADFAAAAQESRSAVGPARAPETDREASEALTAKPAADSAQSAPPAAAPGDLAFEVFWAAAPADPGPQEDLPRSGTVPVTRTVPPSREAAAQDAAVAGIGPKAAPRDETEGRENEASPDTAAGQTKGRQNDGPRAAPAANPPSPEEPAHPVFAKANAPAAANAAVPTGAVTGAGTTETGSAGNPVARPDTPAVPMRDHPAARPLEAAPGTPAAVSRDVSWHLADEENQVAIHLAERAGEVRVLVRTPDRTLAESLRADLPELVGRLRQEGFAAESGRAPAGRADATRRADAREMSLQDPQSGGRRESRQRQPSRARPAEWSGEWRTRIDPIEESHP